MGIITDLTSTLIGTSSKYTAIPHPGTGKTIQGWQWDSLMWEKMRGRPLHSSVPTLWYDSTSGLETSYFQSGIGDMDDLKLETLTETTFFLSSGYKSTVFAPVINHGNFYINDEPWYLFSDSHQCEPFSSVNTVSGYQYLTLKYEPKPGTPIEVVQFKFNRELGRYQKDTIFRQELTFTNSGVTPEFKLDTSVNPPKVWLNGKYTTSVGTTSGLTTWDNLGLSFGVSGQQIQLTYNPIDPASGISLSTYTDPTSGTNWTVHSGYNPTITGSNNVYVDRDLGIVEFIYDTPVSGNTIAAHYSKTPVVLYEPINTENEIEADYCSVKPINAGLLTNGNLQLTPSTQQVASVYIYFNDMLLKNREYLLKNKTPSFRSVPNYRLYALVTDASGLPVKGQTVNFGNLRALSIDAGNPGWFTPNDWQWGAGMSPAGSFRDIYGNAAPGYSTGNNYVSAITNQDGIATVIWMPENNQSLTYNEIYGSTIDNITKQTIIGTLMINGTMAI